MMTKLKIPETIFNAFFNNYYDKIEIYSCILLSLVLQIFLNVGGTFRRLASSRWIVILLWLAYLLADIVAIFGLGLVVSGERMFVRFCNVTEDYSKSHQKEPKPACSMNNYTIFWAPFFLAHLGGPDTITAFAPEDNELWPRHLIYLASQCFAVAYIFYQSLQFHNHVVIPTLLMLLCGIIKCVERTAALYYGSAQSFRNSMLTRSNQDASIKEKESKLLIINKGDALSDLQLLQYAFVYFTVFKKLVVDLVLSIHERDQSRLFFLATSCQDAFRLVEIELNYLYDVLFTKLPVLHHTLGYCSRTLSFLAVVTSFICISRTSLLHTGDEQEVVTLILVIGAVGSELIGIYLLLFCDWTIINIRPLSANTNANFCKHKFLDFILFVNKTRSRFLHWFLRFVGLEHLHDHGSKFTDSRWANSLSTFNLIFYCLHRPSKIMDSIYSYFGLVSFLNGVWYVKPRQLLSHSITSFIFDELKMKSEMAESLVIAKQIFSSKGEWVLENEGQDTFLPFVADYNYDDILLLWHIATDICYNDSQDQLIDKEQSETAKKLSDYMLYLMVTKPDMMSAVSGIGEKKFQDTCTEVGKLFDTKLPQLNKRKSCNFFRREGKEKKEALQRKACETILSLNREIEPDAVPRDRSILINASILAGKLKLLPSEKKWLIISKLWVELLSYGATHIRSSAHAEQLSRGGELITVVWLLMAHFGLGDQYENNPEKQA